MIIIIANPHAGRVHSKKIIPVLNQIKTILKPQGPVELVWTRCKGDATLLAREAAASGAKLVIAAGGDGTLHEVANGLAKTQTPLSLFPLGTENVFAKFVKMPLNVKHAASRVLKGKKQRIDLGKIRDQYFLLFAGIGFDAYVVKKVSSPLKRSFKSMAFVGTALAHFLKKHRQKVNVHLSWDGQEIKASSWLILIGNISRYGWQLSLLPKASPVDGKLDAVIFPSEGFLEATRQVVSVFRGTHLQKTGYFQFKKLFIRSDPPVEIQADGELIGTTPCEISVVPKALWVQF